MPMDETDLDGRGGASCCAGCGRAYAEAQWSTLDLVKRLDPAELVSFARPWPRHLSVEARACRRCGRAVPRLVPTSPQDFWRAGLGTPA
ncbi:MAG TPA: hypothetical protein VKU41_25145 [Polyangiaceae bacterium]|nr:hypothetical protein [Polyangiaceae bacterium]